MTQTTQEFPIAKTANDRFRLSATRMKWKDYAKSAGINEKTPTDERKKVQKAFMDAKRETVRNARALGAALISDNRFNTVSLDAWTDKEGNQRFSVSGNTKRIKTPKSFDGGSKAVEEMSIDELKAVIAEREAGNVAVVNG